MKKMNCFTSKRGIVSAFTLAEMMVVMLILSVILAAMAPVMTTRYKSKPNDSSPWKYEANNRLNAYFGGPNSIAMIGQNEFAEGTDEKAKLLIKIDDSEANYSLLAFKRGNRQLGRLYMNNDGGMMFGSTTGILGANANSVGRSSEASGTNATAFGSVAKADKEAATAIGSSVTASGVSSLAVGTSSNATADNSIAIGNAANGSGASAVAIGQSLTGSGASSVTIGQSSTGSGANAIAIGNTATGSGTSSISLGASSTGSGTNSVALSSSTASGASSIAIGQGSLAEASYSIVIGDNARAPYTKNLADSVYLGHDAVVLGRNAGASGGAGKSVVIGSGANVLNVGDSKSPGAIAIGANAEAKGKSTPKNFDSSIAIGSKAQAHGDSDTYLSYEDILNSLAIGTYASAQKGGVAIGMGSRTYGLTYVKDTQKIRKTSASGKNSIAIGLNATANGENNIALGSYAGYDSFNTPNTPAKDNIAIGAAAAAYNTLYNIAIGTKARSVGGNGVAIGANSRASGLNNVAIGRNACSNVTGSNKICIGANSGPFGSTNANGEPEGKWKTDDVERIFIGSRSAQNGGTAVLEVHNGEKDVGFWTDQKVSSSVVINGNLLVKGQVLFPAAPHGPSNDGNNKAFRYFDGSHKGCDGAECEFRWREGYSNGNVIDFYGRFGGNHSSDRRLKYVGKENTSGLDKIRQLKIFNYTYKKDTTKTPHVGVIAQDLQKVFPNAVKKGADGFLTIRMEDMFYAVINAIKELDAKYQAQEKRINELEKRIEKLEAKAK